jgi:hypothetical protein
MLKDRLPEFTRYAKCGATAGSVWLSYQMENRAMTEATKTPPSKQAPAPKEVAAQPSGPKGDNPATAGPGNTNVRSNTPENAKGHLNPSAPEDANTTPGTTGEK